MPDNSIIGPDQRADVFRLIAENVTDLIAVLDTDGRRIFSSPSYKRLFGDAEQLVQADSFAEIHPEDRARIQGKFRDVVASGIGQRAEFRFVLQNGGVRHIESESSVIRGGDGHVTSVVVVSRDITERLEAERRLVRLSNLYAARGQTSQTIARSKRQEELFPEICRIAVKYAHFRLAWIGLIDKQAMRVVPVAASGDGQGFLQHIVVSTDPDVAEGRGPIGACTRQDRPYVCNDFFSDPQLRPWWPAAAREGFASVAAFPFTQGDQIVGVIAVYPTEKDFFGEELVTLLWEMAADITFALDNFELERRRNEGEKSLLASEAQKSAILESALDCIITADHDGRIIAFNPAAETTFGYRRETMAGKTLAETIIPKALREAHNRGMARYLATGESRLLGKRIEVTAMRADGSEFAAELAINAIHAREKPVFTAYVRDITERKNFETKILRLSSLYAALSETNEIIARGGDRDSLFREVCRIAVAYGHFKMAWIGLVTGEPPSLSRAAASGEGQDFLRTLPWPLDADDSMGRGPAATAVREGRPYICNDIFNDPNTMPWRQAAARAAFRATASFPLRQQHQPVGVLGLYATEVGFFDASLTDLLQRMAANISFALDNFARERQRSDAEKALQASESRYRQLVNASPEAIMVVRAGRFLLVNPACVELLGAASAEAVIGQEVIKFVHPEHHDVARGRVQEVLDGKASGSFGEGRWLRADGSVIDVEVAGSLISYEGAAVLQAVVRDITERKHIERILRSLAEGTALPSGDAFFPALVQHLAGALEVRYAVVAECLGPPLKRARVLAFWKDNECIPGYEYDVENTPCKTLLEGGGLCYYPDNVQQHFPGNTKLPALNVACYLGLPLIDTAGNTIGHVFAMHDRPLPYETRAKSIFGIFAARAGAEMVRRRAEDEIRYIAHHDGLTGLANRVFFQDRLSQAIALAKRSAHQLAVLVLDLDRFKNINDTLGHEAGDRALKTMAERLKTCLRQSDTIARVGGDEFMVLVDDFSEPRYLAEVAQKVLDVASRPILLDGQECDITASVGIATYPDDGADALQLLKNGDIAMYRAKGQGRNNYQFYSAQMNVHTLERLALESRLRRAIDARELVLHYQPKVCLISGRVTGVEALVRWQHPEHGLLPAGKFIPLAEESDLIIRIGEWVIGEACMQIRRWMEQGLPAQCVAVNLSARQFSRKGLLPTIHAALRTADVNPACLEFELTESVVMHRPDEAVTVMHELKALGVGLSIDDFGTGYSSLAYLKRFPIDSVKIDRSFIQHVPNDRDDMAITQAVIAMAHSMRRRVIAEGVENEAQVKFLRQHQCDEFQGYYFSKPLTADALARLLLDVERPSMAEMISD